MIKHEALSAARSPGLLESPDIKRKGVTVMKTTPKTHITLSAIVLSIGLGFANLAAYAVDTNPYLVLADRYIHQQRLMGIHRARHFQVA